jgi:hypothetical protein
MDERCRARHAPAPRRGGTTMGRPLSFPSATTSARSARTSSSCFMCSCFHVFPLPRHDSRTNETRKRHGSYMVPTWFLHGFPALKMHNPRSHQRLRRRTKHCFPRPPRPRRTNPPGTASSLRGFVPVPLGPRPGASLQCLTDLQNEPHRLERPLCISCSTPPQAKQQPLLSRAAPRERNARISSAFICGSVSPICKTNPTSTRAPNQSRLRASVSPCLRVSVSPWFFLLTHLPNGPNPQSATAPTAPPHHHSVSASPAIPSPPSAPACSA